jgi:hypothetical protein
VIPATLRSRPTISRAWRRRRGDPAAIRRPQPQAIAFSCRRQLLGLEALRQPRLGDPLQPAAVAVVSSRAALLRWRILRALSAPEGLPPMLRRARRRRGGGPVGVRARPGRPGTAVVPSFRPIWRAAAAISLRSRGLFIPADHPLSIVACSCRSSSRPGLSRAAASSSDRASVPRARRWRPGWRS